MLKHYFNPANLYEGSGTSKYLKYLLLLRSSSRYFFQAGILTLRPEPSEVEAFFPALCIRISRNFPAYTSNNYSCLYKATIFLLIQHTKRNYSGGGLKK